MPAVSVILPTYNRAAMLCEAIESVRAQTYLDWELIVVDDGSTDETPQAVAGFAREDVRIRLIRQENRRLPEARNSGIRASQGRYVAFLDDDDLWVPEKLALQMRQMESAPQLGLSYTLSYNVDRKGRLYRVWPDHPGLTYTELFERNFIPCSSVLIRRACLDVAGVFDPSLRRAADYDLWLRVAREFSVAYVPYPLLIYRRHGANATSDPWENYQADLIILRRHWRDGGLALGSCRRRRRLAAASYEMARSAMDRRRWGHACRAIFGAVRDAPEIGIVAKRYDQRVRWPLYHFCKPYLALGYCCARWIASLGRESLS